MREASQNNTSASVASASVRTIPLELSRSSSPSTSGPTSNPTATKTIAGVTGVPDSRPETAATASSVKATMARAHSTGPRWPTTVARASSQRGDFRPLMADATYGATCQERRACCAISVTRFIPAG